MISPVIPDAYRQICPEVICFGDSDWWYHNRGHMDIQLMLRYAQFAKVLYINSIVVRKFNVQEGAMFFRRLKRKSLSILRGMKSAGVGNMMVYSPFSMPVHHIPVARYINQKILQRQICYQMRQLGIKWPLVWVACPGAAGVAVNLARIKLIYQRSDCYEELVGIDAQQIKKYDRLLKKHADLVLYVNRKLMAREKDECKKAIFLDHGVDYKFFANAHRDSYIPEEMKRIPHPILGFYGNIDEHTTDISLVERLADLLGGISIVLIGTSTVDLSSLKIRKNVYLLGQRPYEQIPHYAKCFDVCFMPWKQNEWIKACNPVKLKEYLALGKPIVSTPFGELENYLGLVKVASNATSFAEIVRQACNESDPESVSLRRKRVSDSTWDVKAKEVLQILCEMG